MLRLQNLFNTCIIITALRLTLCGGKCEKALLNHLQDGVNDTLVFTDLHGSAAHFLQCLCLRHHSGIRLQILEALGTDHLNGKERSVLSQVFLNMIFQRGHHTVLDILDDDRDLLLKAFQLPRDGGTEIILSLFDLLIIRTRNGSHTQKPVCLQMYLLAGATLQELTDLTEALLPIRLHLLVILIQLMHPFICFLKHLELTDILDLTDGDPVIGFIQNLEEPGPCSVKERITKKQLCTLFATIAHILNACQLIQEICDIIIDHRFRNIALIILFSGHKHTGIEDRLLNGNTVCPAFEDIGLAAFRQRHQTFHLCQRCICICFQHASLLPVKT